MNKNIMRFSYGIVLFSMVGLTLASVAYAAPSLSQTNINIGLGQTISLSSQGNSTAVYVSANTGSAFATIQTNGQQITVIGVQIGGATATICYVGTATDCTSLNVNVQAASVVTFNQNNIHLNPSQSTSVVISGGSGTYSISSNSNTAIVGTALSGNTITVSGIAVGSANIVVCDNASNCGTLYVTVSTTSASNSSGSISFDNSSPTVLVGQNVTVNISGGSGYYVSSNSNSNAALPSVNGSAVTVTGVAPGTATISVCGAGNICSSFTITVTGSNSNSNQQGSTFGVSSQNLNVGQTVNISLTGGSGFFISTGPASGILQPAINGTTLVLTGVGPGSTTFTLCATSGGCTTVTMTVTGNASTSNTNSTINTTTNTSNANTFSNSATVLSTIQAMQAELAQILAQIQSMTTTLNQLAASVSVTPANSPSANANPAAFKFTLLLNVGSQGAEVLALQQKLTVLGFFTGTPSGYFGPATQLAVKSFQSAHNLPALGYVGPSTRDLLNK